MDGHGWIDMVDVKQIWCQIYIYPRSTDSKTELSEPARPLFFPSSRLYANVHSGCLVLFEVDRAG